MAKKRQEIALMREIESQEEWEDVMGKEGLWVVDVYQEWSGPCNAMTGNFRRMKNELGDDLLNFAMAKADTIESLEKYRGSCEPCFLFYAAGVLVSFVHGANAPLILRTLTEQLTQEHKVQDGSAERKEVKDPFIANREAADDTQKDDEDEDEDSDIQKFQYNGELVMYGDDLTPAERYEEVEQGFTVAIIKPNVVSEGKVDDILDEMKDRGIEVITQEERQLTEEEAREFYSDRKDEDYFEDLVSFMASGPSHVLVLTKGKEDDSVIKDWRDMLGPPTVEDAKEQAPECLRAKYGQAGLMNALHGSDSKETAARELAFFFPHMHTPTMHKKKKEIQRTLALIRPDAFNNNRDAILEKIKEAGFQIALQKEVSLTKEQAEAFYSEHAGQSYYEELTTCMSRGPLLALGLAREDAVQNWRGMLGPTSVEEAKTEAPESLRAQFAVNDTLVNQLHGSEDVETAKKELDFFFPVEQTVAMIKPDGIGTKDEIIDKIHQAGFRIAARKETIITKEIAESFYQDQKDKPYFNDLVEHMTSGPTMFMVLSREGAVGGWRQEIGPVDPTLAKEQAPDSLRAQFGTTILKNAVHGCSSSEEAKQKIQALFGDMEFNPDGTVKGEVPQEPAEEQAVSGSPVPQAADVAPEYRQEAEQQQQAEQQQEAAGEQQEAAQEPEAKAQEQEAQQAEQPAEAEGQVEAGAQGEEKPAEAEGEAAAEQTQGEVESGAAEQTQGEVESAAEQTQGEVEEKPSETTEAAAESAEKDESAEKTEGEVEEKPTESAAESAEKDEDAGKDPEAESSHSGIDLEAGQATQEKATEEQDSTPSQENKPEEPTPEQAAGDKPEDAAAEQTQAKTEEEAKDTPATEEAKDTKVEDEQKDQTTEGQKEEESKGEQKEGTAEAKKEGEDEKKEA